MKDVFLERKGGEKEPQQTLALKMFAALILLAGSVIPLSASRSMHTKLPPRLQLDSSKVVFSVIACSAQGAGQPVPVTCPHRIAQSHLYANRIGMLGKARAAARVELFRVWIGKISASSNFLRRISPAALFFGLYSHQKSTANGQEEKAKRERV